QEAEIGFPDNQRNVDKDTGLARCFWKAFEKHSSLGRLLEFDGDYAPPLPACNIPPQDRGLPSRIFVAEQQPPQNVCLRFANLPIRTMHRKNPVLCAGSAET